MWDWIVKYWVEVAFGLVVTALTAAVKHLYDKVKKNKQEDSAMKEAILSLLDDSMGRLSDSCKAKNYATREEARRYERMYEAYHGLGGNGAVTNEHSQFIKLDVREQ